MQDILGQFALSILAGLVVWLITSTFYQKQLDELHKTIEAAPRKYVEHLDLLIQRAVEEGPVNARVNARAIVSTRDDLKASLESVAFRLNSEINKLDSLVKECEGLPLNPETEKKIAENSRQIYETVQVLSRKWPAKIDEIEIEFRKLLAQAGLPITVKPPKLTLTLPDHLN